MNHDCINTISFNSFTFLRFISFFWIILNINEWQPVFISVISIFILPRAHHNLLQSQCYFQLYHLQKCSDKFFSLKWPNRFIGMVNGGQRSMLIAKKWIHSSNINICLWILLFWYRDTENTFATVELNYVCFDDFIALHWTGANCRLLLHIYYILFKRAIET